MNKASYIYIDDFSDSSVMAIRDGLQDTNIIDVDFIQVAEFKQMILEFEGELKRYDGVILDLRLDGNAAIDVKFTASGLAQELRNRSAANEGIKDVPIILCSTDKKIREYYNRDHTSHDLFDYRFVKDSSPNWDKIATKLQSLANGYEQLKKFKGNLDEILYRDTKLLDSRILGKFSDKDSEFPIHEYSQHFLKEVIRKPGPLIQEKLLASRLGIDIEKSQDWSKLVDDFFSDEMYQGVFSDAWKRWWMDRIQNKFKSLTGKRLASLNAVQRVNSIVAATKLSSLVPAEPIEKSISTKFWTLCEYYKRPLDPLEGYKIHYTKEPKPWQDQMYLSFEAASERKGLKSGLKVHADDIEKLKIAKQAVKN
ncbi:hypothetical protein [Autumnicola musiva]|uniref:Response regulator n=1 Tax=Autumnicola musiva TaxID=3075589 RepID=A0ABU3D638_9FLAO|nr:hypothetical protein [Zunongwangia sp. F117]MDT0676996.1 hypothetical protein [Zunongwangia sp. F117]